LCAKFAFDTGTSEYARDNLHKELSVMDRMNHPNVMRAFCLSLAAENTAQALLLPLTSGNLWCWLRGLSVPTSAVAEKGLDCQRKACLLQIVHGLAHMHSRAVLHLDLKPDNVLWDGLAKAPTFRIADFGNCRLPDEDLTADQVNSEPYRPVELFHMGNSRVHALCRYDVWAYGCMVFDIAQQHPGLRDEAGVIQRLFGQVDMKCDAQKVYCIRNYRIKTYGHMSVQNLILLAQPVGLKKGDQLPASALVLEAGRVLTRDGGEVGH
jgi:serine/threonine protein kinase